MSDINKDDFSQIIKFKIDAESADNISQICDDLKKTKSDIMRQLIPIVSCNDSEYCTGTIRELFKKILGNFAYSWMCL